MRFPNTAGTGTLWTVRGTMPLYPTMFCQFVVICCDNGDPLANELVCNCLGSLRSACTYACQLLEASFCLLCDGTACAAESVALVLCQLNGRRSQYHGGVIHRNGLLQVPLPNWLSVLAMRMHRETSAFGGTPPNHVLVNAYMPGQGILAHEDGPVYHPGVCILSLGASTVLNFWRKEAPGGSRSLDPEMSVLLMPRSLLVFLDDAYADCLHGIDEVVEDRLDPSICNLAVCGMETGMRLPRVGERVSLTVRRVKRVQRNLIKLA
ncbi:unnamed protein product [Ostreobium quekettii]|uniref:Fe2OG dioxygenase domain-containing protein n=1 Tax=Ostreobium quekettii TaxID=121088 RepID=A0A8S1IZH8_9CHLO|nr:unnamed protein product [Ostreobium quekettii]